jgi:glycosyltransferase involved in cell wall biosynthesis
MLIGIDASRAVTGERTGTEAYAFHLIQSLIALTEGQNYQLRLYFNQPPADGLFPNLPHIERCIIPFTRLWTHVKLANELRRRAPDVFFTPAHVIPFVYRGSSVATVHDLGYHYFPEAHTRRQLAYLKLSTRSNGRISRKLIADSEATRADLIKFYDLDPHKIEVIYPGIDPQLKPVTDENELEAAQQKYNITAPYLLFISTLQPRKNLVRLIQAYAATGLPHELVLAGSQGWRSAPILDEIARLDLSIRQRILLTGFVEDADKAALISGATALLYPSLYEGFGFPLLEGQTCGTPVMAANTSSLPEIAGGAALLVDPEDSTAIAESMRLIVEDSELRLDLRNKGYVNVKRFTWEKAAIQVLQTLEQAAVT